MSYVKTEFKFPSASGLSDIHAARYLPEGDVKACFQIAHGMAEHFERYESFIDFMCSNGYAVYVNDHLGHGGSVSSDSELGFFGEADGGWRFFVEDCHKLTEIAKGENPGKPYIFFGHSMGSFVARSYIGKYGDGLTAAVVCGTAGANPAAGAGILLAKLIGKIKGSHHRSPFIDNIAFGAYNKRCQGRTQFDWLTKDEAIVDKYIADKYCGFLFTAYGFRDMFELLSSVSGKAWYQGVRKDLPILLIAGEEDPVGAYGKGVQEVKDGLSAAGVKRVELHLYPNARHEILNESDTVDRVQRDIAEFIGTVISDQ